MLLKGALLLRRLRRWRAHAIELVATLAVGTGAICGIWVVLYALLAAPLPYRNADRLTVLWDASEPGNMRVLDQAQVAVIRESSAFDIVASYGSTLPAYVSSALTPSRVRVSACTVDPSLLEVLGAPPAAGSIRASDLAVGPAVVLSARLADRLPGVAAGARVRVNELQFTVAAILQHQFWFPDRETDLWISIPEPHDGSTSTWSRPTVARLPSGVTLHQALSRASSALAARGMTGQLRLERYRDALLAPAKGPLLQLRVGVVLLLVLVVLNAGWLFVAHVDKDRRTLGICRALGATRAELLAGYLTEAAVIAVLATPIATMIALAGVAAARSLAGDLVPLLADATLSTSTAFGVLGTALTLSIAAAVPALVLTAREVSGEAPWYAARADPRRNWAKRPMMVVQAALVFGLAAQGISLVGSLAHVLDANVGFGNRHLLTAALSYREGQPLDVTVQTQRGHEALARLHAFGFQAALANAMPLSGTSQWTNPRLAAAPERVPPMVMLRIVSSSYFRLCRIPLHRGRLASPRQHEVVVSNTFVARRLGVTEPLGARLTFHGRTWTITGVVASTRDRGLGQSPDPEMYVLYEDLDQLSQPASGFAVQHPFVIVDTEGGVGRTAANLRAVLTSALPDARVDSLEYFPDQVWRAAGGQPVLTVGIGAAASLALLLLAAGFNGLIKHGLTLKLPEIGIRLALGATPRRILIENLKPVLGVCTVGAVAGLGLAAAFNRSISAAIALPPDAVPNPLIVGVGACVLVLGIVLGACYRPVAKAAAVNPLSLLRVE